DRLERSQIGESPLRAILALDRDARAGPQALIGQHARERAHRARRLDEREAGPARGLVTQHEGPVSVELRAPLDQILDTSDRSGAGRLIMPHRATVHRAHTGDNRAVDTGMIWGSASRRHPITEDLMRNVTIIACVAGLLAASGLAHAATAPHAATGFKLVSPTIAPGSTLTDAQVANTFGCSGKNI